MKVALWVVVKGYMSSGVGVGAPGRHCVAGSAAGNVRRGGFMPFPKPPPPPPPPDHQHTHAPTTLAPTDSACMFVKATPQAHTSVHHTTHARISTRLGGEEVDRPTRKTTKTDEPKRLLHQPIRR